jgi:hypothetical protein
MLKMSFSALIAAIISNLALGYVVGAFFMRTGLFPRVEGLWYWNYILSYLIMFPFNGLFYTFFRFPEALDKYLANQSK